MHLTRVFFNMRLFEEIWAKYEKNWVENVHFKWNRTYLSKPLAENDIWSYRVIPTHSASQRYKCKILYLIIALDRPPPKNPSAQHIIAF